jgi:outer membrane protein OmpA-like peptidoglycan-associated protein
MESNLSFIVLFFLILATPAIGVDSVFSAFQHAQYSNGDKNCPHLPSIPRPISIRIPFVTYEAELSGSSQKILINFLKTHQVTPTTLIKITGHTDLLEQNDTLSLERATILKKFMVTQGLIPDNIFIEGVGDSCPVASNATDDGRFLNRCADIHLEYLTP